MNLPKTTTIPSNPQLSCNFENKCSWENSKIQNVNWVVINAANPQSIFAPDTDHTYRNDFNIKGYYLTLSSLEYYKNLNTSWQSPILTGTNCVEFYMYMHGRIVSC